MKLSKGRNGEVFNKHTVIFAFWPMHRIMEIIACGYPQFF